MTRPDDFGIPDIDLGRIRDEAMSFAEVGIYRYREDGTVVFMDRVSLRLLDLEAAFPDPSAVIGRDIGTLLERLETPGSLRRAVFEKGRVRDFEYHYRTLTGKERWVHHNSYLVRDPATGERQIQVIAKNITERKEQELEERERAARMQQTQKLESLGILAGGIAHDFNNLLAAMLGNAELARMETANPESVSRHLDQVIEAASQAAGLCRQLLAYAGRSRLDIRPLDLSTIVKESISLVRLSASRRSRLSLDLADGPLPVLGDAASIRQILLNLVINASEAIGEGTGRVQVTTGMLHCTRERLFGAHSGGDLSEGAYVFLTVEDDGPGMDAATADRIFEPFFTTKFTGRGLGLASVLGILTRLSGAVEVDTAPGRGSRFTVLLPAAADGLPLRAVPAPIPKGWSTGGSVLVADDEPLVLRTITGMVERLGLEVLPATDGQEAVELFARERGSIRLVVLDLTMPRLSGAEAFERIRSLVPGIPVLFSSGYEASAMAEDVLRDEAVGFLKKPYGIAELETAVRRLIGDPGRDRPGG